MKIRFNVSVLHVIFYLLELLRCGFFSHKEEQEDETNKQRSN